MGAAPSGGWGQPSRPGAGVWGRGPPSPWAVCPAVWGLRCGHIGFLLFRPAGNRKRENVAATYILPLKAIYNLSASVVFRFRGPLALGAIPPQTRMITGFFAFFKNLPEQHRFNEFYARDTSRKIRDVQKAKGERGVPLTVNVPYGYVKDPENPRRWLIDPEAAQVVQRIFQMCMEGRGPQQIANQLRSDKVLTPTAYKKQQGRSTPNPDPENPHGWGDSSVVKILERREYTGCTVNFKTYSNSIWYKKQRENPVEKQAIFPGTHERIIEDDVFEKVQVIRQQRHRMTRTGRSSIFSGLVYCADCCSKMQYGSSNNGDFAQDFFDCSLHKKNREKCGGHFIRVKVLERMMLKHIQLVTGYILRYEAHFRMVMEQQMKLESAEKILTSRKKLNRDEKRIAELKRLFIKIYEDNASGRLSDERFDMLSQSYEAEQKQL